MRASTAYLGISALLILLFAGLLIHARHDRRAAEAGLEEKRALVRRLELSDLCIFTEASYSRHPSQTDLATAFQDSPASFEHFPSGMLAAPAPHLTGQGGALRITREHVTSH